MLIQQHGIFDGQGLGWGPSLLKAHRRLLFLSPSSVGLYLCVPSPVASVPYVESWSCVFLAAAAPFPALPLQEVFSLVPRLCSQHTLPAHQAGCTCPVSVGFRGFTLAYPHFAFSNWDLTGVVSPALWDLILPTELPLRKGVSLAGGPVTSALLCMQERCSFQFSASQVEAGSPRSFKT